MLAIIGGSGFSRLPELKITHREVFRSAYGVPSCPLLFGKIGERDIVFLARHGFGHTHAPHEINYRANIDALKQAGVKKILSLSAVAAMNDDFRPGDLVLPHDLIDYTFCRDNTFFSGNDVPVAHSDFSAPYNPAWRSEIEAWVDAAQVALHRSAIYACLQGPRLPTRAEVCRYRRDGGDVYGMTGMPEAALAQEKEMAYAHLCGVIGMAVGCGQNGHTPQFKPDSDSAADDKIRRVLQQIG